jgi:hypothetical protein
MAPGVAGIQQRRPAASLIDGYRRRRVGGQVLTDRLGVAEHARGQQAAAGDAGIGPQHLAGPPRPALDRGVREIRHLPAGGRVGIDGRGKTGPAREAQFPRDDQLSSGQADRAAGPGRVMAGQAIQGRGIAPSGSVPQLFGPTPQLVKIGARGKRIRHGFSLRRLRSAARPRKSPQPHMHQRLEVDSVLPADPVAPSRRH